MLGGHIEHVVITGSPVLGVGEEYISHIERLRVRGAIDFEREQFSEGVDIYVGGRKHGFLQILSGATVVVTVGI